MPIKPQSIRKGVTVKFNDEIVDKQTVISASELWTPNQDILFKKLLKQGGAVKINDIKVEIIAAMQILNSKNEKEVTAPKIDPLARF